MMNLTVHIVLMTSACFPVLTQEWYNEGACVGVMKGWSEGLLGLVVGETLRDCTTGKTHSSAPQQRS